MKKNKNCNNLFYGKNLQEISTQELNLRTLQDYYNRLKKIALSMFEWVNLPSSMDARYLEHCLFYNGSAAILYHKNYGIINTNASTSGNINIYGIPTSINCFSINFNTTRKVYTSLDNAINNKNDYAILVQNDWERIPTCATLELFAYRLFECERTSDTNIKSQKNPFIILCDAKQTLTMKNLYNQVDSNVPIIFGDKYQLSENIIKSINTQSPFIADKILDYKKEIWNEALTFLGINNILLEKKERLVSDEANSNNELINLNLQSYLAPRQYACKQFNELFNLDGENKISVKVRSDLKNIIKEQESIINFNKEDEK